ncbi:ABC transporter substrate-binding protein [Acidimangrovimonas sediminis]|uniref:ABC transporter substrate-binding protein n=1 Tax=Acidimangrovimonas sediminis TaxID=2056283 RepID=UPI000C7FE20B|nr:ABC transporter substrate-binding protein [Acidimangrovimonas sediminis]
MNDELRYLAARAATGGLSRRAFLGRAAALGVTTIAAGTMLSDAARAAEPKKGGSLTMGLGGGNSTDTLDPALAASQVPFVYLMTAGDRLTDVGPKNEIVMNLAEEVSSDKEAKTWTFKIRKGVKFHNGKDLTPDDVHKTMLRHSDKDSKSGALGIMKGIESMKVDGDNFVVTLHSPNADLPFLMADYHLIIQPNGGMDKPDAGIFTGPYKIDNFEPGVRITFSKNKDYWNEKVGHYDNIVMLVINDATARNAALQSGQVQMVNSVDPKTANLLKRVAKNVDVTAASGRGFYCFNMFCDTKPFENNDLRMALKLAIDREELVKKILAGYGSVGNDMPVNKAYPLFPTDIPQRSYDPDKAKHHFKKSGHDGPITLLTADGAFAGAVDAAQLFQQSAAKAGITIDVKRQPNDGYWTDVWNKKPFSASYWGGRPTQDQMYSTAYISSADWNDTRFKDPKFDKIIVEARGELDKSKREQLYHEAGMMMRDQGGLINPMFNQFVNAHDKSKVAGWFEYPNQDLMNGLAGVLCWQA